MSSTIIYKQSYKARADPSTPGLNVRHLQYIATRPGAVYNIGCGFGLWGHLPDDSGIRIQNDLERAKHVVREASHDHTLYRAIISVGKEDAQNYGLYHRERWEQLLSDNIQSIAKEMDIKPENLCWCASMHQAKDHPHVHILYWDNSDQPRPDHIPKEIFRKKAEHIRAVFAGKIHREELRQVQQDQREQMKSMRTALQAMCREANPEKALDISKLYRLGRLDDISDHLSELLRRLPQKGSLRFAYLPPDYKQLVEALIDRCLQVPELAAESERYEQYTRQICELYANGQEGTEDSLAKARLKLRKELGNEVMEAVRSLRSELQADTLENLPQARSYIREVVSGIVPTLDAYQNLLQLRTEDGEPLPDFYDSLNTAVNDILADGRIRLRLQASALEIAGINMETKPDAPRRDTDVPKERSPPGRAGRILHGKLLSDAEWTAYRDTYRQLRRMLKEAIQQELIGDLRTNLLGSPEIILKRQAFSRSILTEVLPGLDSYKTLLSLLPPERIPIQCMEPGIEGYHDALNNVVGDVLFDGRVRLRLQTYSLEAAGIDLNALPDHCEGSDVHVLYGKDLSDEEWDAYQDAYRDTKRELRRFITEQVREDAEWTDEALQTHSAMLLCGMMRLLSQASHQQQAGAALARLNVKIRSKDASREAKKDYWFTRSSAAEWDDEFGKD